MRSSDISSQGNFARHASAISHHQNKLENYFSFRFLRGQRVNIACHWLKDQLQCHAALHAQDNCGAFMSCSRGYWIIMIKHSLYVITKSCRELLLWNKATKIMCLLPLYLLQCYHWVMDSPNMDDTLWAFIQQATFSQNKYSQSR